MVNKKDLEKLKHWWLMLLDLWEGGNPSNEEIEDVVELNNISAYKQLVTILRDDGNEKQAKELEGLIEKIEKKHE